MASNVIVEYLKFKKKSITINSIKLLGIVSCLVISSCSSKSNEYRYDAIPLSHQGNSTSATYPEVKFNVAEAKDALRLGTSKIEGSFCVRDFYRDSYYYYADRGTRVSIYPVTPHLQAWYKLKESKGTRVAYMDPEAIKYRIDTEVYNDKGRFQFDQLAPGKYYIQGYYGLTQNRVRTVYTHTDYYANTHYYKEEPFTARKGGLYDGFIEIKKDGDIGYFVLMEKGGATKRVKREGAMKLLIGSGSCPNS